MYDTVTEGHEYEVIEELGGRQTKEEFSLKECPAYILVTAPGGGAGGVALPGAPLTAPGDLAGGVATNDGRVYKTLS